MSSRSSGSGSGGATLVEALKDHSSILFNQLSFKKGDRILVDWNRSNESWLFGTAALAEAEATATEEEVAAGVPQKSSGLFPANSVRLIYNHLPESEAKKLLTKDTDNEVIWFKDAVFGGDTTSPSSSSAAASSSASSSSSLFAPSSGSFSLFSVLSSSNKPPPLTEGLDCFVWPLSRTEFLEKVWKKKAFCVLGAGERLRGLQSAFLDFKVEPLLDEATELIAWVQSLNQIRRREKNKKEKKKEDGDMQPTTERENEDDEEENDEDDVDVGLQYLYVDNENAKKFYQSGCSIYFNPSIETQQKFIIPLARDLGTNFGLEIKGDFGGDIECFACKGEHVTDWHFDGQENFTVQVRGTKRWTIVPSYINSPVTNCQNPSYHPSKKYREQRKCHRFYSRGQVPALDFSKAQTFILRPGSVFYFPAGYYHHVVSESDDVGSFSINFSMDTAKWGDLLCNAFRQLLWKNEQWREHITVGSPVSARAHLQQLLEELPKELSALRAEDLLPTCLFLENRPKANPTASSTSSASSLFSSPSTTSLDSANDNYRYGEKMVLRLKDLNKNEVVMAATRDLEETMKSEGAISGLRFRKNPIAVLVEMEEGMKALDEREEQEEANALQKRCQRLLGKDDKATNKDAEEDEDDLVFGGGMDEEEDEEDEEARNERRKNIIVDESIFDSDEEPIYDNNDYGNPIAVDEDDDDEEDSEDEFDDADEMRSHIDNSVEKESKNKPKRKRFNDGKLSDKEYFKLRFGVDDSDSCFAFTVDVCFGNDDFRSNSHVSIIVEEKEMLHPLRWLISAQSENVFLWKDLIAIFKEGRRQQQKENNEEEEKEQLLRLLRVLNFAGFIHKLE